MTSTRNFTACVFQSAPLTDVRGDVPARSETGGEGMFQSAPLTDVRGDACDANGKIGVEEVSIRSPH